MITMKWRLPNQKAQYSNSCSIFSWTRNKKGGKDTNRKRIQENKATYNIWNSSDYPITMAQMNGEKWFMPMISSNFCMILFLQLNCEKKKKQKTKKKLSVSEVSNEILRVCKKWAQLMKAYCWCFWSWELRILRKKILIYNL